MWHPEEARRVRFWCTARMLFVVCQVGAKLIAGHAGFDHTVRCAANVPRPRCGGHCRVSIHAKLSQAAWLSEQGLARECYTLPPKPPRPSNRSSAQRRCYISAVIA